MFLSNLDITSAIHKRDFRVDPLDRSLIRPGSICLRLGSRFLSVKSRESLDIRDKDSYPECIPGEPNSSTGIMIPPRQLILASTLERIALSREIAGWLSNLSGLARLGLQVVLSNYVSPGYGEQGPSVLTLELFNHLDVPARVYPGMRVCHLILVRLSSRASSSYDSQVGTYSNQLGPTGSSFYQDTY